MNDDKCRPVYFYGLGVKTFMSLCMLILQVFFILSFLVMMGLQSTVCAISHSVSVNTIFHKCA